jgi:hypothetical protein
MSNDTFTVRDLDKNSPTKYAVQWPESYLQVSEWADVEGGPTVRWTWEGMTHLYGKEYYSGIFPTNEECQKNLQKQVAPVTAKSKTWLLVSVVGSLAVMSSLSPAGLLILLGTCFVLFSVFTDSWFFNDDEREAFPDAFKTVVKEAAILALVVAIVSGVFIVILWIVEKIAAFFSRLF